MTALVDTHTHVDLPDFDADRDVVLERAGAADVRAIVLIGYSPERWRSTAALCAAHPWLTRAVGLHPNSADSWSAEIESALRAELARGDALAIGEIGLDFYRERADGERQRAAFTAQLQLAREFDLPIVIHQRSAEDEVLELLAAHGPQRGVMHCFSGDRDFARRCLDLGLLLGIGGVATYPKSGAVREAIASTPLERIVLETDAPFLAPQSRRGTRNEPAYVVDALATVAHAHGVAPDIVGARTTANALALFGGRLEAALAEGRAAA